MRTKSGVAGIVIIVRGLTINALALGNNLCHTQKLVQLFEKDIGEARFFERQTRSVDSLQ